MNVGGGTAASNDVAGCFYFGRNRANAGHRLDNPQTECYIHSKVKLGWFPNLLTEKGVCPVHGKLTVALIK